MALHSYLTVKVIQMYKFDSYASPRALFKNRKLYFRLNHVDRLEASLFDHELLILVRATSKNSKSLQNLLSRCA